MKHILPLPFLLLCVMTMTLGATVRAQRPTDWRFVPPLDAESVVNVRDYGATGNGVTDDTLAIQRAIAENIETNRYRSNPMIYFPDGTYLVTGPIEGRKGTTGWSAGWRAMAVLIGETRDGTVIKLQDKAPGYSDPKRSKWVVAFGSEGDSKTNSSGGGNRAFRHGLINLTVDVGAGNPGAIGVDFIVSNRGCIDNVTVRAGEDSGYTGIAMTRNWPGPGIIMDTRIEGFATGMALGHYQYGMTFENIEMAGQREVGIRNFANVLTMRRVSFTGTVPFYDAGKNGHAMLCLLDSQIQNTGPGPQAAITTAGFVNLRRVDFSGYSTIIKDTSKGGTSLQAEPDADDAAAPQHVSSYDQGFTLNTGEGPALPLDLPIAEIPIIRPPADAVWVDGGDTGESLQAAIDAGAAYIYIRPARAIVLTETLELRGKLRLIFGLNGHIKGPAGKPAIHVADGDSPVIQLEHLYLKGGILHDSARTLVLRHCDKGGLNDADSFFEGRGAGETHVIDVIGRGYRVYPGHRLWARQLNAEFGEEPLFANLGGTSWLLGFKMESSSRNAKQGIPGTPCFVNKGGGKLELFGGLLYTLGNSKAHAPIVSAFTNESGSVALSYRENGKPSTYYQRILSSGGERTEVRSRDIKGPGAALLRDDRQSP